MKISILIPCYNEEKSIRECVESCLNQTRKADEIVVVNDGSTDGSRKILEEFGFRIKLVNLPRCTGNKSYAQEVGLQFITGSVFVCTDGDTILDASFIEEIEKDFEDKDIAAVSGYVISLKHNWLTACREIDYIISQNLHKRAQSYIGFLMVIPGCAAAFRSDIFREHITFNHDTVTEDLDFTYKLNFKGLKIKFNENAISYTQDPADIHSYINQMRRWYRGGWQNLKKHRRIITKPAPAFELTLVYVEGLFSSILLFVMPFFSIVYFGYILLFNLILALGASIYGAIARKRPELLAYAIFYPVIVPINALVFITEFFKVFILKQENLAWFQPKRREMTT